jgi:hypothetical protein
LKAKQYYQTHQEQKVAYAMKNQKHIAVCRKKRYYNNINGETRIVNCGRNKQYRRYLSGRRVHDVIVEKVLGRRLKKGELVHHFDDNGLNNNHNNLLICTRSYHRYLHKSKGEQNFQTDQLHSAVSKKEIQ